LPKAVKAIYVWRSAITFSVEAAHYVFTMVRRRGKRRVFTRGDVNRLIDSMLHPFMRGGAEGARHGSRRFSARDGGAEP